jgi:hypothetical protein
MKSKYISDTVYNDSSVCKSCGSTVNPVERLFGYDKDLCTTCKNIKATKRVKGGMV